ncbi:MAG: ATP-binding protein [Steroidobacteraceae bacterium]
MSHSFRVEATADRLPEANAGLDAWWAGAGLPDEARFAFELVLEEIFMNVVMHGSPPEGAPCMVDVSLDRQGDGVVMEIADDGLPFDPLAMESPDTAAPMEDRRVGGLGVYLVREMMDTVHYRHSEGRNRLSVFKSIGST